MDAKVILIRQYHGWGSIPGRIGNPLPVVLLLNGDPPAQRYCLSHAYIRLTINATAQQQISSKTDVFFFYVLHITIAYDNAYLLPQ